MSSICGVPVRSRQEFRTNGRRSAGRRWLRRAGSVGAVTALACGLLATQVADANAAASAYAPCSAVIVAGTAWLGGQGVDVHSNGAGGASCRGSSVKNKAFQFGGGWQCVELAARLYYVKNWGTVWAGVNGGARYIPEGSPNLQFVPNGSGQLPVPGDLIIEAFGYYGHVTVVDRVEPGRVLAVEQNASISGRKVYPLTGSAMTGSYGGGLVRGFMHSPANSAVAPTFAAVVNPPTMAPITVKATVRSLAPARLDVAVNWARPTSSALPVTGYEVIAKTYYPSRAKWTAWRHLYLSAWANSYTSSLPGQRKLRVRVRASNAVGWGSWSNQVLWPQA